jgi:outer membrane protein OmpA-like peptidoglycan-associated protein
MKKIVLYSIIFLFCVQGVSFAQSGKSRKAEVFFHLAEKEFNDQRYMYSIPFYRTSLKYPGRFDSLTTLHLAEAYWHVKNYDSAEIFYLKYEAKYGPLFSSRQHLSELAANRKDYITAAEGYKKLQKEVPLRFEKLLNERYKGFSNTRIFLNDSLDYDIRLLKLNTKQQDFSPQYFGRGMVFVSNRYSKTSSEREFGWDGLPFANIYWVKDTADLYTVDTVAGHSANNYNVTIKPNDDYTAQTSNDNDIIVTSSMRGGYTGSLHKLAKFSDELSAKYNYGPLCFNKEGNRVYFTRNTLKSFEGRYNLEICEALLENGKWGKVKVLPFVEKAFDFYHPAISGDGKRLYFCSNKPGGQGGSDIYYIDMVVDSAMTTPYALDIKINTSGDELFPTFRGDTLFFSTDGFAGLGGLDIYKTWMEKGKWKTPVNVGYPLNSSFDDFGLIYNNTGTRGFFSTNRLGTDDIYMFGYLPFFINLQGTVLSRATLRRLDSAKVIIRSVEDDKPVVDSFITDLTGNFHFPVKPGRTYSLEFSRNGYIDTAYKLPEINTKERELALEPTLLTPIAKPLPPVVEKDRDKDGIPDPVDRCPDVPGVKENFGCPDIQARINELAKMVFFKTASAELSPVAIKPLNEISDIMAQYPWITLSIEGHTDSRASAPYNLDLSNRRAASVRMFFIKRGLAANRFTSIGYGLTRPIADNNTEEGRALNRRVAMKADFHSRY